MKYVRMFFVSLIYLCFLSACSDGPSSVGVSIHPIKQSNVVGKDIPPVKKESEKKKSKE